MSGDPQIVQDALGEPIVVGTKVRVGIGADDTAVVTNITDWDVDYNDDVQRAVMYTPKITVRYPDDETEEWSTSEVSKGYSDDIPVFVCEDMEVITDGLHQT